MNLYQLTKSIDPVILDRGRDYLLDGNILSIEIMGNNTYRAEVEGSQLYEVYIELGDEGMVISSGCDCPYDYSPVCKHQAAVLLKLRDLNGKLAEFPPQNANFDSPITSLKELLEAESKESLIDLICLLAADSDVLEKRIHLHLTKASSSEVLEECRELIQSYIDIHADDHGFVNWRNVSRAVEGAYIVAEKACAAADDKEWVQAVEINLTIMEEMIDFIQSTDDSGGNVGVVIDESLERLREITLHTHHIAQADRNTIFQLLLDESKQPSYNGWGDWQLAFIEMASHLALTSVLREQWDRQVEELSNKHAQGTWGDSYFAENLALMRYQLIQTHDGDEQARDFIIEHLSFSKFRVMAIDEAYRNGNYDEVIRLTEEGEALDLANGLPGLVKQWKQYRYEAYSQTNQTERQRSIGVEFLLDGDFSYYKTVKSLHSAEEWATVYQEILRKLELSSWPRDIYTKILIEEKEYAKLLAYIQKRSTYLEEFHLLLYPHYPAEIKTLFLSYIEAKANASANRRDYEEVCRIILMLYKVGGKEEARQVIGTLKARYPRRPAFQDELMKI